MAAFWEKQLLDFNAADLNIASECDDLMTWIDGGYLDYLSFGVLSCLNG
jgi:hypothetical protein